MFINKKVKNIIKLRLFCFFVKLKMIKRYKYSIIISIVICYLSLKSLTDIEELNFFRFPHIDKVVHFCMYFGLMSVLILETYIIEKRKHPIVILALIPFFLGILMELFQGAFTTTRSADVYDAMFNTLGVLLSVAFWLIIKSIFSERFK